MNVYDFISSYRWWREKRYINKSTYSILKEDEYSELSKDDKKNWILAPRFSLDRQEQWARKFLKTLPYKDSIERIENYYMIKFKTNFMHGFHVFCEDNNLWEDYLEFEENEEIKIVVSWCKKNGISYDTETYEEKRVKRFLTSMGENEKILEFKTRYENKQVNLMEDFDLFCKENGLWEKFLKFQEEEIEENWRKFFEEHRHDSEE